MKRGKRYQESQKLIDKEKSYDIKEALETILKMPKAKFDETVELHVKLGVDSKHADQQVRGTVAVSYTHLDVYKRQMFYLLCKTRNGCG